MRTYGTTRIDEDCAVDQPERELVRIETMARDVAALASEVESFVTRFHGIARIMSGTDKEAPPCGYRGHIRALEKAIDDLRSHVSALGEIG